VLVPNGFPHGYIRGFGALSPHPPNQGHVFIHKPLGRRPAHCYTPLRCGWLPGLASPHGVMYKCMSLNQPHLASQDWTQDHPGLGDLSDAASVKSIPLGLYLGPRRALTGSVSGPRRYLTSPPCIGRNVWVLNGAGNMYQSVCYQI
jgi:hypothetical protein